MDSAYEKIDSAWWTYSDKADTRRAKISLSSPRLPPLPGRVQKADRRHARPAHAFHGKNTARPAVHWGSGHKPSVDQGLNPACSLIYTQPQHAGYKMRSPVNLS